MYFSTRAHTSLSMVFQTLHILFYWFFSVHYSNCSWLFYWFFLIFSDFSCTLLLTFLTFSDSSYTFSNFSIYFFRLFIYFFRLFHLLFQTLHLLSQTLHLLFQTFPSTYSDWLFYFYTFLQFLLFRLVYFTHRLHPTSCFTHWTVYQCMFASYLDFQTAVEYPQSKITIRLPRSVPIYKRCQELISLLSQYS